MVGVTVYSNTSIIIYTFNINIYPEFCNYLNNKQQCMEAIALCLFLLFIVINLYAPIKKYMNILLLIWTIRSHKRDGMAALSHEL